MALKKAGRSSKYDERISAALENAQSALGQDHAFVMNVEEKNPICLHESEREAKKRKI